MRRNLLRISVAALAFAVGVCSVYLVWLATLETVAWPEVETQMPKPEPVARSEASDTRACLAPESGSVREEWEELAELGGCTFGRCYYHPSFESYQPGERYNPERGVLFSRRWVAFLRRDKGATVPFLLSQIPNKAATNVHIDPLDNATKGELAVYCLQFILKANWDELSPEYKTLSENVNYEYTNHQALLRRLIGTRRGAKKMADLWRRLHERSLTTPGAPADTH